MWLSPFRVSSQIWGRWGATLCYLFILQVAVLPLYGLALLLGGVSPAEIGIAGLVIGITASLGASLGLWCSARAYRSSGALGAVFVLIALWSLLVYQTMQASWTWMGTSFNPTVFGIVFSHPIPVLYFLLSPDYFSRFGTTPFSTNDALSFSLTFQITVSLVLLWSAMRLAARPLPDRNWSEGNRRLKAWKIQYEASKRQREERREREKASQKVTGALLYELPVEKFVRFSDPLLSREVRGHFRLRQSGLGVSLLRLGVFAIGAGFWLMVVFNAFDHASHAATGPMLLNGLYVFGALAVGVMASTSLVRERESGTWEGLRLSLLPPEILVRSKWLSPIITFIYWSAPLWILLPLCLRWNGQNGVSPLWLIMATLVLLASLGTISAWGLWISRRTPHSAAATSWTLATLLFVLLGLPTLDSMTYFSGRVISRVYSSGPYSYSNSALREAEDNGRLRFQALLDAYHPLTSMNTLLGDVDREEGRYSPATKLSVGLLHLIYCLLTTVIVLRLVTRQVKKIEE